MALTSNYGLFGTKNRANVLLILAIIDESHASELSRLLGTSVSNVQKTLDSLEQVGIVSGVVKGRERRVSLSPRFFALTELRALLEKVAFASPELIDRVGELRRRPRRAGKEL